MKWPWRKPKVKPLVYGLHWCDCGAPVAQDNKNRMWDCSDILSGVAIPKGQPGSMMHSDGFPYIFWEIRVARPNIAVRRPPRNQPPRCEVPPPGWWCSRDPGHDGPCAAHPVEQP